MKRVICGLVALACVQCLSVLAADVSSLNTDAIRLSSSSGWAAVSGEGATGGWALKATGATEGESVGMCISVQGSGMLSFKMKYEDLCSLSLYNSDTYDYYDIDWSSSGRWKSQQFVVTGSGSHELHAEYYGYYEESVVWLSDLTWTPAPSEIEVTCEFEDGRAAVSGSYQPGARFEDLETPSRDGYEFAGWCLDAGLSQAVDESAYLPFEGVTVYARWVLPVSLMDQDDISFETDHPVWGVVEGAGVDGGRAICSGGPLTAWDSSSLAIHVDRPGTLTLWWKMTSDAYNVSFEIDGNSEQWSSSWRHNDWNRKEIVLTGGDGCDLSICWTSGSGGCAFGAFMLSGLDWQPAPSSIQVSFDLNGAPGTAPASRQYSPGETFGKGGDMPLPTPSRFGWAFLGWAEETVEGLVYESSQHVPFHDLRLVAKWGRPVSSLATNRLTDFKTTGAAVWRAVESENGLYAEVECNGTIPTYGCGTYLASSKGCLQMTVTGPLFLSYDWMVRSEQRSADDGNSYSGWVELEALMDGNRLDSMYVWGRSASDWSRQRLYIPAGKHTVKWVAEGWPPYSSDSSYDEESGEWKDECKTGPSPVARVGRFEVESVGSQADLAAWTGKLSRYGFWRKGDLSRFAAVYGARILSDKNDYEARILHAVSTLGLLAENAEFQKYAKAFGLTLDYARLSFTGTGKLTSKSPAVNTMVDRAIAVATPSIRRAIEDLSAIPSDWDGSVLLASETWPVDEDLYLDAADVIYARAGLSAALASLNYLGGYDLTIDWAKASKENSATISIPTVAAIPRITDSAAWEKQGLACRGNTKSDKGLVSARVVRQGSLVAFLLENSFAWDETIQAYEVSLGLKSGAAEFEAEVSITAEDGTVWNERVNYTTKTNVTCWVDGTLGERKIPAKVVIRDNLLLLTLNCTSLKGFSSRAWSVDRGYVASGTFVQDDEWGGSFLSDHREGRWERDDSDYIAHKVRNEQTQFFSKVRNAVRLGAALDETRQALELALLADDVARRRPSDGKMHFIEYDEDLTEQIEFARANTRRALESLDAPLSIDAEGIKADYEAAYAKTLDLDCLLLPNNGIMNVYLGALFEGKISRDLLPKTRINAYGELVPDFESIADPTFRGLLPEFTMETVTNLVDHHWSGEVDHSVWVSESELAVPGARVNRTYPQYSGYGATGLPKGWTWNRATGQLSGIASSAFTLTLTRAGYPTVKLSVGVAPRPALLVFAENPDAVAVKGTGRYLARSKVSVTAAIKAGYAFMGWFDRVSGEQVARGASYSFVMPEADYALEARTLPISEDWLEFYAEESDVEMSAGVPVSEWEGSYFSYSSGSPVSVSAKGLPRGVSLKWDSETSYWVLTGKPAQAGLFTATFNAKNAGGFVGSAVVRFWVGREMTAEKNAAGIDLEGLKNAFRTGVQSDRFEFEVPSVAGSAVRGVKVSNLPSGLKAVYSDGRLVVSGVPTKAGLFNLDVAVTYANKTVLHSTQAVFVMNGGSRYVQASVIRNDPSGAARGTVSGAGVKSLGSTVKLIAKSSDAKKYFFAGWYVDQDGLQDASGESSLGKSSSLWRSSTLSFQLMEEAPPPLYARFVTKDEDQVALSGASNVWYIADSVRRGEGSRFQITATSSTPVVLTAKNLPAGTKLSGSTLLVSAPGSLVPGTYDVTVSAKSASGSVASMKIRILVEHNRLEELPLEDLYDGFVAGVPVEDFYLEEAVGFTASFPSGLGLVFNPTTGRVSGTPAFPGRHLVTFTKRRPVSGSGKKAVYETLKASTYFIVDQGQGYDEEDARKINAGIRVSARLRDSPLYGDFVDCEAGSTNVIYAGISQLLPLAAEGMTGAANTLKVSGLPAGLTFDSLRNRIVGTPTKTGSFIVKVSASNKWKWTGSTSFILKVSAIPVHIRGNFLGVGCSEGSRTMYGQSSLAVSSLGKVSGKLLFNGGKSVKAFSGTLVHVDEEYAVASVKIVGESVSREIEIGINLDEDFSGSRAQGCAQFGWENGMRAELYQQVPLTTAYTDYFKACTVEEGETVLKISKDGTVSWVQSIGLVYASGKTVMYRYSGKTTLIQYGEAYKSNEEWDSETGEYISGPSEFVGYDWLVFVNTPFKGVGYRVTFNLDGTVGLEEFLGGGNNVGGGSIGK